MCLCTCAHSIVVWHVNIVTTKESILLWTGALCTHDVSGLPVQFCPSALKVYPSSHVVSVIVMVQNCSKAVMGMCEDCITLLLNSITIAFVGILWCV